jgi:hypothetical protein
MGHAPTDTTLLPPVTLVVAGHTWRFRCAPGEEARLLAEIDALARDPLVPFDRFDAAVAAFRLGRASAPDHDRPHARPTSSRSTSKP